MDLKNIYYEKSEIKRIIELYFDSFSLINYLNFYWGARNSNEIVRIQLSSGEEALFTLFSRLYSIKNKLITICLKKYSNKIIYNV